MFEIFIILFSIFVLIAAIAAVEMKDLLSSIMALSVVGFGLVIIFIFLAAPEVVSAQLVIEILCFVSLVVVVNKTSKVDETKLYSMREISPVSAGLFFAIIFIIFGLWGIQDLPKFGEPVMKVSSVYIQKVIAEIGAKNIVTAILMDFRAFNTLIEVVLIITLFVGVATILRKRGRKNAESD
ncbi:MAG: hypothetical protein A2474_01970 [Elusimicrobia bacterium RIFOXYC2_FULL_34_12]|nr:MAG: hypothetical protein A2474_01970 [Elusimicrobia bacterium RIFOXYC2_FULL_34_12]OGS39532.1 MAG: hypothetical protein A2551_05055 [Elusimicrobia bacterium RIFOXYD2_FULL_34_30]HAM37995.1 hypothetical protein [Elusimicrobiota bacterium]